MSRPHGAGRSPPVACHVKRVAPLGNSSASHELSLWYDHEPVTASAATAASGYGHSASDEEAEV